MVFTGVPSKGCAPCRAKKTKVGHRHSPFKADYLTDSFRNTVRSINSILRAMFEGWAKLLRISQEDRSSVSQRNQQSDSEGTHFKHVLNNREGG